MNYLLVILTALLFPALADAAPVNRSSAARLSFAKHTACPPTGLFVTRCPGYVIDHIVPLCAGGPDKPMNMQWQEYRQSLRKDVQERRDCRALAAAVSRHAAAPKPAQ